MKEKEDQIRELSLKEFTGTVTRKDVPGKRCSTRKSVKARESVYAQEMCGKRKLASRVCQNL